MLRIPLLRSDDDLARSEEHPELDTFVHIIHSGRYFNKLDPVLLKEVLKQGELLSLEAEEYLIREGDTSAPEMYILLEGSLAVISESRFILRLELPGDVAGELAVISPAPRSADVVAETDCRLIVFSNDAFHVAETSSQVPVFYLMLAHIMAEKLRVTTAQSLLRKDARVYPTDSPKIAIIDVTSVDRLVVRGALQNVWEEAETVEYEDPQGFIDNPLRYHFELLIVDVIFDSPKSEGDTLKGLISALKMHGAPIFAISSFCNDSLRRVKLTEQGVDELLGKPYSIFDLKHTLSKFRTWYYKDKELDHAEHAADTDRLTNLANRRRLDEFMSALVTLYPENKQPFSMVMSDVDNFKHYNDTHGHQMGDVVLAMVASIFSRNVRKGDLAARFGGEEFVVVLPNCSKPSAAIVAEKLRKAIEEEAFPYQEQQPTGNLTVTFGVATFPDDAEDIETLLKKADDCLYKGKQAGRNIVVPA